MFQEFPISRSRLFSIVVLALGAVTSASRADYAYIGYYNSQEVTQLTLNSSTQVTSANVIASGYAPESILSVAALPGANPNQLYIVDTTNGGVRSYNATTGAAISTNILENSSGQAITLSGMAGAVMSSDGRDFYVTSSTGSSSGVYEFDTVTGKEVGFLAFQDAHDVAFHNGMLYVTAYGASNDGYTNTGVWQYNANLTGGVNIIPAMGTAGSTPTGLSSNDLYNASGMTFVGNNLFVGNSPIYLGVDGNGKSKISFVQEYNLSGASPTYVNTFTSPTGNPNAIYNPFGLATGPDGNVYVSSLGTIGQTNGSISEINVTTGAVTTWLANGSFGGAAGNAPKYLSFNSEAVSYVPEPGSNILMGIGLAGLGLVARIKRRKVQVAA